MKGLAHTNLDRNWAVHDPAGMLMLERVRASLRARLDEDYQGGDTEVMRLVDEIVKKEGAVKANGHAVDCWCSQCG